MNMFWVLCTIVCLAIFVIAMAVGTVIASLGARFMVRRKDQAGTVHLPGLLFALRIFPVVIGLAITLAFALPSFLLLEPTQTVERPDPGLLLLSLCAALLIAVFVGRAIRLLLTTKRTISDWAQTAAPLHLAGLSVPIFVVEKPESLIAVTGFFRPTIFIGRRALGSLGNDELRAAIAHESAHIRSLDNFKQFFLHVTRFPKFFRHLATVEAGWLQASELAADQGALDDGISPLDLASTLVKIGRLKAATSTTLAVSHLVPSSCSSTVAMRVQWLQSALAESSPKSAVRPRRSAYPLIGVLVASTYFIILPAALPIVHRFIEWLVR